MWKDTSGPFMNQPNLNKILGEVKQSQSVLPVAKKPSQTNESAKPNPNGEPEKEAKKEELVKPKTEAGEGEEEAP